MGLEDLRQISVIANDKLTPMGYEIPDDTRGIVDPAAMMRWVDFQRWPAGEELEGLICWFWSVGWDLPTGRVHHQQVLSHPAGNISVGTIDDSGVPLDPAQGRVYGVHTGMSHRRLSGSGWTVAGRTAVGGVGVFANRPAREILDQRLGFDQALPGIDGSALVSAIDDSDDVEQRVALLRRGLEARVRTVDPAFVAEAREVVAVADLAERDRSVCRVDQLARAAGVSVRSLQRLFDTHVGASPSFVIRRWRIIDAAEEARRAVDQQREWSGWAAVAADLGYADQAHLARDFRRHLGVTPSDYIARNLA